MTSENFCYWLQGFFELSTTTASVTEEKKLSSLTIAQTQCIQRHLDMVFRHEIDPSLGTPEHQQALLEVHEGTPRPWDPHTKLMC